LLGRREEIAAVERVLDRAREGVAGAIAFVGPAGIGKTTLLDAAWERAAGFERVRIAGAEAEADLGWSGLASLVLAWPGLDDREAAPLREVIAGARHGAVSIGMALHALVVGRSERAPVLLVIDDAQWLDAASAEALAFAIRRFAADRVAVVVAQRTDHELRFAGIATIAVDGLDADACRDLVASRFALPAAVVERCIEVTGGNPLALLHVCDALPLEQRTGERPIEAAGALPDRLAAVFAARLDALPDPARTALVALAASHEGDRVDAALAALGAGRADWGAAESAGAVTLDGRPRFTHPLWGAAALAHATPALRRRVHRALADHAGDADRAALHRAAGAERADERVAAELDALGERAAARGLSAMAARAWTDAARLSESADRRQSRELAAAQAFWDASMPSAAVRILDPLIEAIVDPRRRAAAVLLRNQIRAFTEDARGAALALRTEADRVRAVAADLELPLASAAVIAALIAADAPLGLELSTRALACAVGAEDRLVARALRGYAAVHLGDGSEPDAVRAIEGLGALPPEHFADDHVELFQLAGYVLLVRERWEEAERALRGGVAHASRRGLHSVAAFSSALLAELEFRRGRWLDALTGATLDIALSEARAENRAAFGHTVAAHVLAHQGDAAGCTARARFALETSERAGFASIVAFARTALGASALAHGDTAAAAAELAQVWAIRQRGGVAEAGVTWYAGDWIEALVAEGRRAEAAEVLRDVERNAAATGGRFAGAVAARGRALLGRGTVRDAIAAAEAIDAPFEQARTRLALVEHGRADAAGADLDAALATFERLGARPWAARARARLGAQGESAPSLAQLLTDAELRVAIRIGRGSSNAAAAAALAVSVRTVDAHLRSIFRKLAIKSRSELVLRVAQEAGRD
jgi:DNA-binding CsgD family transcriptional regulator